MGSEQSSLADLFTRAATTFTGSPLYQALSVAVADDETLLEMAAQCQPGHRPPNVLFAAVHQSVKRHPDRELAQWYASVVGPEAALDPAEALPAFAAYCREHADELLPVIRRRYVQTNVVKRAAGLRFGLAEIATRVQGPAALVEVGCSAGLLLRHDAYGYTAAGQTWGSVDSPVMINFDWRSDAAPPDLDALPIIDSVVGLDLNPIDSTDPEERSWLEALVWPENLHEAELLSQALDLMAGDPPRMIAEDAPNILPTIDVELPAGQPVIVFHSFVRAHVPRQSRARFDAAIDDLARHRPLFHLSLEGSTEERFRDYHGAMVMHLTENSPDREPRTDALAIVEQHGEWILPLPR